MSQAKNLSKYPELIHYFGDKQDSVNLEKLGIKMDNIIMGEQVHGKRVKKLINCKTKRIKGIDGMITSKSAILGIRTADCLPIFLYDPVKRIIAAIHAGWRGLHKGIIKNALKELIELGGGPMNLKVAIGPHIQVCCYKVSKGRIRKFQMTNASDRLHLSSNNPFSELRLNSWYLNLSKIALFQLKSSGIKNSNIEISDICTSCDQNYWSFRRDGIKSGRMINILGLN